jgi:Ion channel
MTSAIKYARASVQHLLTLPPWTWVGAYVALLFVATGVYLTLPARSFYEPNLGREPTTRADGGHLAEQLTEELNRTLPGARWVSNHVHWKLAGSLAVVGVVKPANGPLSTLAIAITGEASSSHEKVSFEVWFFVLLDNTGEVRNRYTGFAESLIAVTPTGPEGDGPPREDPPQPPESTLFPLPPEGRTGRVLSLRIPAAEAMTHYYNELEGDPAEGSGEFLRMLYFSASTVTTLGVGDIQPMTSTARFLATIEAFFGVIIIGLFLNALANRARGKVSNVNSNADVRRHPVSPSRQPERSDENRTTPTRPNRR